MSADLIAFIAVGPRRISCSKRTRSKCFRAVRVCLKQAEMAAGRFLVGDKRACMPGPLLGRTFFGVTIRRPASLGDPGDANENDLDAMTRQEYQADIARVLACCDMDVAASYFSGGMNDQYILDAIDSFVDVWNCANNDVAARIDPFHDRHKIVVAGDMTYGEEPDYFGYQALKVAYGLGIAQFYGVL